MVIILKYMKIYSVLILVVTLTACEANPSKQSTNEAIENLNEAMEKANKTIQKQKAVLDSTMGKKQEMRDD
jgi:hypothetical protein